MAQLAAVSNPCERTPSKRENALTPRASPVHGNLIRETGKQLCVRAVDGGIEHQLGKGVQGKTLEPSVVIDGAVQVRF